MPMPHQTQMRLIKRRLVGKEGSERNRELRAILAELPNYKNGPFADIRKWVNGRSTRQDTRPSPQPGLDRRAPGGAAQIALVGPPNAGKSSLLQALSAIQIKTGDYAFTTTRPVPALTRIGMYCRARRYPGTDRGCAMTTVGGGRALLGVLRGGGCDCLLPRVPACRWTSWRAVRAEAAAAGNRAAVDPLAATKAYEEPAPTCGGRGRRSCLSRCLMRRASSASAQADGGSLGLSWLPPGWW